MLILLIGIEEKLKSSNEIPKELLGESREDVVCLKLDKINRAISNLMVH